MAAIPPWRITFKSSTLSAPATIPATIALTLPAGFDPIEVPQVDLLGHDPRQVTPLGQPHHRFQPRTGNQVRIIKRCARHRGVMP
jgi:hypothetical protein